MSRFRATPTRLDRAKAVTAVIVVHAALAALILHGRPPLPALADHARTVLIDIRMPPPPPPPVPDPGRTREKEGAAGKMAEPTPVVRPEPRVELPPRTPIVAAPIAGTGSSPSAGASTAGSGPGAGGSGSGRGDGGSGGGIGTQARLLSGGMTRRDYRQLRNVGSPAGRAVLALMVGPSGQVDSCTIAQTSGDARVDRTLCALLQPRMRWLAARDTQGRSIGVRVYYVAIWDR